VLPPTFSESKQIELYDAYIKQNIFCKNFVKVERHTGKRHVKISLKGSQSAIPSDKDSKPIDFVIIPSEE